MRCQLLIDVRLHGCGLLQKFGYGRRLQPLIVWSMTNSGPCALAQAPLLVLLRVFLWCFRLWKLFNFKRI
ncbi:uncharacterized protein DMAD_00249 [Drosophila madeirensis]|uniref:Uncharacterized protein n=1 Tax=Drosophila madeirensis TaxID=30013 RepID=A0AAU9FWI0_DROMD